MIWHQERSKTFKVHLHVISISVNDAILQPIELPDTVALSSYVGHDNGAFDSCEETVCDPIEPVCVLIPEIQVIKKMVVPQNGEPGIDSEKALSWLSCQKGCRLGTGNLELIFAVTLHTS